MVISIWFTYILKQEKMGGGGERTGTMFFQHFIYRGYKNTYRKTFFLLAIRIHRLMLTK